MLCVLQGTHHLPCHHYWKHSLLLNSHTVCCWQRLHRFIWHQFRQVNVTPYWTLYKAIYMVWWCSGYGIGLAFERSRVRFPANALSGNDLGQVVHTNVPLFTRDVNKATEYKAKATSISPRPDQGQGQKQIPKAKASLFKAKANVLLLLLHSAY